jgi:hypothetical protein
MAISGVQDTGRLAKNRVGNRGLSPISHPISRPRFPGADGILTYFAMEAAELLAKQ